MEQYIKVSVKDELPSESGFYFVFQKPVKNYDRKDAVHFDAELKKWQHQINSLNMEEPLFKAMDELFTPHSWLKQI